MGHEHIHTYIQANRNKKNTRITKHQENTLHINNIMKSTGLIAEATSIQKKYQHTPIYHYNHLGKWDAQGTSIYCVLLPIITYYQYL